MQARHDEAGLRLNGAAAAALAAGLMLRAGFVHWAPEVSGDPLIYGDIARDVIQHHVYGRDTPELHPTWIRLPGYPLFLAFCFLLFGMEKYSAILWVNVAVDLATCWLIGETAARLAGKRAGMAALWMAALCPFTANYTAVALTEVPSLFCVAA